MLAGTKAKYPQSLRRDVSPQDMGCVPMASLIGPWKDLSAGNHESGDSLSPGQLIEPFSAGSWPAQPR